MLDLEYFSSFNIWPSNIPFLVNVFWMWSALLNFRQRKPFYFCLNLNFHLQKCYNSVMYLEFFAVYFNWEELFPIIFYSWIELFFFSSDLLMEPHNSMLLYHLLKHWHQFDLIFYYLPLFKILVRKTVEKSTDVNVAPPSIVLYWVIITFYWYNLIFYITNFLPESLNFNLGIFDDYVF